MGRPRKIRPEELEDQDLPEVSGALDLPLPILPVRMTDCVRQSMDSAVAALRMIPI